MRLTADVRGLIKAALKEDLGKNGDLTSEYFVPPRIKLKGKIIAKAAGIVAGLAIAEEVFRLRGCRTRRLCKDGSPVLRGRAILEVRGGREALTAERVA